MLLLVLALLINPAVPAAAQNTLRLPDVTLLGEYTLFLAAPDPKRQEIPMAHGLPDRRLRYPHSAYKVEAALPDPPVVYWQSIPGSAVAAPGLPPAAIDGNPAAGPGAQGSAPATSWQASIDYIPGTTVVSRFEAVRSSGVWDLSTDLLFGLADGWVASPPTAPTDFTFAVQAQRRAEPLNFDGRFAGGAFYGSGGSAVFTLDAGARLYGETGALRWREETQLAGISLGSPPTGSDAQRGAVQQDLQLALVGSALDLSLQAAGILAAGMPSRQADSDGFLLLELGFGAATVGVWAGAAALYYDDSLFFYPSGKLELYPAAPLSLAMRAAPFVHLPRMGQRLPAVQSVQNGSSTPQLETEGGYSLYSELRLDPAPAFAAVVSFEWRDGRIYLLEGSDQELGFVDADLGVLGTDLIWQVRTAAPAIRVNLELELAVPFPLSPKPWQDITYSRVGAVWRTDFHKLPLEFIIKALIGDYADDGSQPFVFTDWEILSGLTTSIEGNWKIGTHGTVHTGFEIFLTPDFASRLLIGYGIRR